MKLELKNDLTLSLTITAITLQQRVRIGEMDCNQWSHLTKIALMRLTLFEHPGRNLQLLKNQGWQYGEALVLGA